MRPRGQAAYVAGSSSPVSVDLSSVAHIPGVQVLRKGDFIGVVAPHEYDAIQAAAVLKVKWATPPQLTGSGNQWESLRNAPAKDIVVIGTKNVGDVDKALASSAKTVSATYAWPIQIHGVIGPSAAVADVRGNTAHVLCQFQGGYDRLRPSIAQTLGLPVNNVRLTFFEGASTFGHNCSDHAAVDASLMSQMVGKPVRVQYMRWDEHGWDNYSPPVLMDLTAGLDTNNKLTALKVTAWESPAPGTVQAPATQELGFPNWAGRDPSHHTRSQRRTLRHCQLVLDVGLHSEYPQLADHDQLYEDAVPLWNNARSTVSSSRRRPTNR